MISFKEALKIHSSIPLKPLEISLAFSAISKIF